jgi:putative hydrolase of the HAD superfamily
LSQPRPAAVLLDVGFTLTFPDAEAIARYARDAGVDVTAAALAAVENEARRGLQQARWAFTRAQAATRSKTAGAEFFERLLQLAGANQGATTLAQASERIWARHLEQNIWCRVGAGGPEALARLKSAGILMAVVSNSEGTVEAMLKAVGLDRYLETVVDSWVVGVAKPDPAIFQIALDRLRVPASSAVMLGDIPAIDVDGARAAGVTPVLIDPLDLHLDLDVRRVPDVPAYVNQLLGPA